MERRLWNNSLPQTLMISAFLLYANVVTALLFRAGNEGLFATMLLGLGLGIDAAVNIGNILGILFLVASVGAGFLIVNERKVGWKLGVAVAAAPLVAYVLIVVTGQVSLFKVIGISLLFDVALFVALVHPQSRDHQKVWFS